MQQAVIRDEATRRLAPGAAAVRQEFLRLNRRRLRRTPPLTALEHERWMDLRWQIEEMLGGTRPGTHEGPPRKSLRVPSNLEVRYADPEREEISPARVIGEGGLFLATEEPLAVGTPLHLKLTGDSGKAVEIEGAVVWVRRRGEGPGPPGMGIQFEGLDDARREAIAYLVEAALAAL